MPGECKKCDGEDTDEMVACDKCEDWFHYACVSESPGVAEREFLCEKCAAKKDEVDVVREPDPPAPVEKDPLPKPDDDSTTDLSVEDKLKIELSRLDRSATQAEKEFHLARQVWQKQMKFARDIAEKNLEQERMFNELRLAQEREILEKKLAAEADYQKRQKEMRDDFARRKASLSTETAKDAEGGTQTTPKRNPEVKQKPGVEKNPIPLSKNPAPAPKDDGTDPEVDDDEFEDSTEEDPIPPPCPKQKPQRETGPTRAQLAARQVLSKPLPPFTGDIEQWPLFYSSFVNTTEACGFTDVENVIRLRESLDGFAWINVRSRLMRPSGVSEAIETLRMLYGRPEQLIHALQQKVRKTDSPRADRLETFIPFGIAVQELVDHLEATDSKDHLVNPSLIHEMVDKLPDPTKREWVQYKRFEKKVTLRSFANFISIIVSEAMEVTLVVEPKQAGGHKEKPRAKDRGHVHTHSGGKEAAEQQGAPKPLPPCRICGKMGHRIRNCDEFRRMKPLQRLAALQKWKLCERCLNEHEGWCKFKITCNVGNCRQHHHPLVHRENVPTSSQQPPEAVTTTTGQHHAHLAVNLTVIFRIIPVVIKFGAETIETCAYLDEGSDMTLVEDSLVRELGAVGKPQPLLLQWTANIVRQEPSSQCLSLKIRGTAGDRWLDLTDAHTVRKLHLPRQTVNFRKVIDQYQHLQGVCAEDQVGKEPRLLIGLNNIYLFAPQESRVGGVDEPIAVRTNLGWTIYGPRAAKPAKGFLGAHGGFTNEELHDHMREYFTAEDTVVVTGKLPESKADRRANEILKNTTVRVGDRFETGLLWKSDSFKFPNSYKMALKRLCSLERRLKKNPALEQAVREQIRQYQEKQYAHVATPAELAEAEPDRIWYLPLNVVLNPKKPDKVRMVWDAAAQVDGVSLNSQLLAGPDLLTSLPAVVQKFRQQPVAFVGDICEMYHQLRIKKEDKHSQRFLYRSDSTADPDVFLMDVATFGSACSPSSAQYVKNLNATEHVEQFPKAAKAIIQNHYVDDYLDSTATEDEAIKLAEQVRHVHSKAGFVIRNWVSNSGKFMRAMGETERAEKISLQQSTNGVAERVLGIVWYPKEDVFRFSTAIRDDLMPYLNTCKRPTKRIALSCIMSLFDPLGLLALFTVHGKLLLQDLWRLGFDWDDEIDDGSYRKWTQWRLLLPLVELVTIPRCYLRGFPPEAYESLQLHVFVDASEQGYGCVAYFRLLTEAGVKCALVMAKTKVASLKQTSIPRLELNAAVLGVRMMNVISANHELKITKRVIWSDSRTVLSWIRSEQRKYKPFVAFRIGEILQETKLDEWRWVPTKLNIADVLTKWGNGPCLDSLGPWFCGPSFLYGPEHTWPTQPLPPPNTTEELRACFMYHTAVISDQLIDVSRISRWDVLLRTACCVLRFISNCRRRIPPKPTEHTTNREQRLPIEALEVTEKMKQLVKRTIESTRVPLMQAEYEKAEHMLWRQAQGEFYADEIATLQRNREHPREKWIAIEKSSEIYHLSPFLDEFNVLRVDGRTAAADYVPYDTRFPVIMPRKHLVTERLIEHYHQRYGHGNRETVVNELRQRFYISTLRAAVSSVMEKCPVCKLRRAKPSLPRMAPLPIERLTPFVKPFSYVGLDYFGPIDVTVGRRSEKRWVALFTCLNTRAIHLEVAHRLNADSCIMAIRRFVLRRGPPIAIFSDNGTNFKAAEKELREQIRRIDIASANVFTNARTRWSFNPPSAPHMGGIWERMVRSAKSTMQALYGDTRMNDEILLTVIAETEEIINSRPLVYVPQESSNAEAITPNHFIRGSSSGLQDPSIAPTNQAEALRSTYKRSQYIADELWKRWLKEYLPSLNLRTKWLEESKPLEPGMLVFIIDDGGRNGWLRGVVEQVVAGKDGRIRRAKVRTASGAFWRPVAKLAVIELESTGKSAQEASSGQGLRAGELLAPLASNAEAGQP